MRFCSNKNICDIMGYEMTSSINSSINFINRNKIAILYYIPVI